MRYILTNDKIPNPAAVNDLMNIGTDILSYGIIGGWQRLRKEKTVGMDGLCVFI